MGVHLPSPFWLLERDRRNEGGEREAEQARNREKAERLTGVRGDNDKNRDAWPLS